jgi:3-deoxy-7-phosphoheptulonate synthase
MSNTIENSNVVEFEELTPPGLVKEKLPVTPDIAELVLSTRKQIRSVIRGEDRDRLVVIIGPCSIHDQKAAYEYAKRLRDAAREHADTLLVVMRTYFEKPRTTVGWKGLVNDPNLDGSRQVVKGLHLARETLLEVNRLGVPCATEALDPITPQYIADLLSWASIGARTTESQTHREMASGLSVPVGFKNGTDGSLDPAINALISAGQAHSFLGINADGRASVVKTSGNVDRHIVLRGGPRPNYYREDVELAAKRVAAVDPALVRPVMVDTSHGNSSKDYTRQGLVCRDVLAQFTSGQRGIMGLLIESNLEAGQQPWSPGCQLKYGVSITDGCIGWNETEELLRFISSEIRRRKAA